MQENAEVGRTSLSSGTHLSRPPQPRHLLIRCSCVSQSSKQNNGAFFLGWDPRSISWQWAKSGTTTRTTVRTSIRSLRPFLGTFAGSSTCWVVVVDISLLLFTRVILQLLLLLLGGGRTSSCMPMPKLAEGAESFDRIGMTTRVCSLWLLLFKP